MPAVIDADNGGAVEPVPDSKVPNDGKAFESAIHRLLSLTDVRMLTREKQFGSKKADLYFEREMYNTRLRFAVECKDYSASLTQAMVSKIFGQYHGLFEDRHITNLLIVSRHPLAPSAQSYVDSIQELSFQTESDIRNSIIQFGSYLTGIKANFENDSVMNYHVEPQGVIFDPEGQEYLRTPDEKYKDLQSAILDEVRRAEHPLVVLGSYGIGKTTLARQLFLALHKAWEEDPCQPIPIYISLELMQREQNIEGLLGNIFTSMSRAVGYDFHLFQQLNRMGHFILILDGIDEMRHKLSKEEFLFNVDQFSLLTKQNPRSIILGRPSAFMDEEEYQYVLRGRAGARQKAGSVQHSGAREVHIDLLSRSQITQFVQRFCAWRHPSMPNLPIRVTRAIQDRNEHALADIAKRPIQLMMLLEIFPQLPRNLDKITKASVYTIFIDDLIGRERTRERSRNFSVDDHRAFACDIAWWLWRQGGSSRIEAKQIPAEVIQPFVRGQGEVDDVRRTLVAASFLGTEGGTRLHFPHRSIQEFLIAQKLCDALDREKALSTEYPWLQESLTTFFTPEIVDFVAAIISPRAIPKLLDYFDRLGTIPRNVLALSSGGEAVMAAIQDHLKRRNSPTAMWMWANELMRERRGASPPEDLAWLLHTLIELVRSQIASYKRARVPSSQELSPIWGALLCLFVITSARDSTRYTLPRLLPELAETLLEFGHREEANWDVRGKADKGKRFVLQPDAHEFLRQLSVGISRQQKQIDLSWISKFLRSRSRDQAFVAEWIRGDSIEIHDYKLRDKIDVMDVGDFSRLEEALGEFKRRFEIPD